MMTQIEAWKFLASEFENSAIAVRSTSKYTGFGICYAIIKLETENRITNTTRICMWEALLRQAKPGYWFPIFDHIIHEEDYIPAATGALKRVEWIRKVAIPSLK